MTLPKRRICVSWWWVIVGAALLFANTILPVLLFGPEQ